MGLASQEFANIDINDKEKNLEIIKRFEKIITLLDREENERFLFLYPTLYKALSLLYEKIGSTEIAKE